MAIRALLAIVLTIYYQTSMAGEPTIQQVVEQGAAGQFHCAYKGKVASKKCYVENTEEVVTDKNFIALYGDSKASALSVLWPDKTRSIFLRGDSMEICNLKSASNCAGGYSYKFSEWPDIDYANGLVILDQEEREYIRLWQ